MIVSPNPVGDDLAKIVADEGAFPPKARRAGSPVGSARPASGADGDRLADQRAQAKERRAAAPKAGKEKKRSRGAKSGTSARARGVAARRAGVSHIKITEKAPDDEPYEMPEDYLLP